MKYRTKEECCSGCRGASVTHTCGNQGHPAAPLLRELAEVAEWHPEPWEEFQVLDFCSEWADLSCALDVAHALTAGCKWRRRPHSVDDMQQGVPLPAPLRVGAGVFSAGVSVQTAQRSIDRLWNEFLRMKRQYEPLPSIEELQAMLAEDAQHEEQSDG